MKFAERFCIVAVAMLLVLLPSGCSRYSESTEYAADWSTVRVPPGTFVTTPASSAMSESDYKKSCLHVSYKDFQEDVNAHKGEDIYMSGRVAFVGPIEDVRLPSLGDVAPELVAAFSVGLDDVPDTEQTVLAWLLWPRPLPSDMKTVTSQFVEVWGECQGTFSYGSPVNSQDPNMPVVRVRYMTVHMP